jgi:PLP dependent protein
MTTIAARLENVRARIAAALSVCGRAPGEVSLLAVSKTVPPSYIEEAWNAGQTAFGENQAQEAVTKITALARLPLHWHFIGAIQSNKTRAIAAHFEWVHSVASVRIAARLNAARHEVAAALNVCIQVNVSGEASKSGVTPGEELALAEALARLPRLRLRGLMAIPEPTPDRSLTRRRYAMLRGLNERLAARGYEVDTLSMGMSNDLEEAIAEGATIVRVGTAIFGSRPEH